MAITSVKYPTDNLETLQDYYWFICDSDNKNQVDFKYVFDVYDIHSNQQLIRAKVYPQVDGGYGVFDVGPVCRNSIDYTWFMHENSVYGIYLNWLQQGEDSVGGYFRVEIGEEYGGVTYLNLLNRDIYPKNFTWNVFKRFGNSYPPEQYWYTERPLNNISLTLEEHFFIPVKTTETGYAGNPPTLYLTVKRSDDEQGWSSDQYGLFTMYNQLDIGPVAINNYLALMGATFSIDSNCIYYVVRFVGDNFDTGELKITPKCKGKYDTICLAFMNRFGMFDNANFNLVKKLTLDTERKSFQKKDYRYQASSYSQYSNWYNVMASQLNNNLIETKVNFGVKTNWSYKLYMDYPTDAEYEWLAQLITSPQIYANLEGDGQNAQWYPVTIKNTNYEYSKNIYAGLKVLELDIEVNQTRNGFRR